MRHYRSSSECVLVWIYYLYPSVVFLCYLNRSGGSIEVPSPTASTASATASSDQKETPQSECSSGGPPSAMEHLSSRFFLEDFARSSEFLDAVLWLNYGNAPIPKDHRTNYNRKVNPCKNALVFHAAAIRLRPDRGGSPRREAGGLGGCRPPPLLLPPVTVLEIANRCPLPRLYWTENSKDRENR